MNSTTFETSSSNKKKGFLLAHILLATGSLDWIAPGPTLADYRVLNVLKISFV